jgi:hypothetical protein
MKLNLNVVSFRIVLMLIAGLAIPIAGQAQEGSSGPYSYSGACSSQGSWTRAALSQSNEIRQVITKLKDNPACNGLKNSMEANLSGMEGAIKEIDSLKQNEGQTRSLSQLPGEISSLRSFSRQNSPFKGNVMDLLVGKTIQLSALASSPATGQAIPASVAMIANRAKEAAITGLQLFNNTMASFQEAQQGCLESGPTAAVIASGMVKILGSFASSNTGINNQIALSVQKVTQYLARDKKYVDALRRLNDAEFISSMSCLVEVTTEAYCDALDAHQLFKELTDSQSFRIQRVTDAKTGQVREKIVGMNQNVERRMAKGALAGYYVLTRQVPVVTDWLQKVQMGMTPKLPSQADFKIGVSMTVQNHRNQMTRIEGRFNFGKTTLKSMPELDSKQSQVLLMLQDVAGAMIGPPDNPYENFFLKTTSDVEVYFKLIGIPVPTDVSNSKSLYAGRPFDWLKANFRNERVFSDPEKLADTIEANMKVIFDQSLKLSLAYFNRNFVVDKPQVVGDSLLGLTSNVRDALFNIDQYLAGMEDRYKKERGDTTYLSMVVTTRGKIQSILNKYKELYTLSLEVLRLRESDPDMKTKSHADINNELQKISGDLLDEVNSQFEMDQNGTGYLSNRVSGIVLQDYTMSLKKSGQINERFEDIMVASGFLAMNSMINMGQSYLSKMKIDLAHALEVNKTNIDALENIVTGVYVRNIFNNRIRLSNENVTEAQRNMLAYQWAYKMSAVQFPGENANALQRRARALLSRVWGDVSGRDAEYFGVSAFDKATHPFKQFFNSLIGRKGKIFASPTSEFETNKTMIGFYCSQTLAFANFSPYWALCYDTVLESPLKNQKTIHDPEILKLMDEYLSIQYKRVASESLIATKNHPTIDGFDRAKNMEARICAVRDYHERNRIAEITSAMRDEDDTDANTFLKSVAEDLKKNLH